MSLFQFSSVVCMCIRNARDHKKKVAPKPKPQLPPTSLTAPRPPPAPAIPVPAPAQPLCLGALDAASKQELATRRPNSERFKHLTIGRVYAACAANNGWVKIVKFLLAVAAEFMPVDVVVILRDATSTLNALALAAGVHVKCSGSAAAVDALKGAGFPVSGTVCQPEHVAGVVEANKAVFSRHLKQRVNDASAAVVDAAGVLLACPARGVPDSTRDKAMRHVQTAGYGNFELVQTTDGIQRGSIDPSASVYTAGAAMRGAAYAPQEQHDALYGGAAVLIVKTVGKKAAETVRAASAKVLRATFLRHNFEAQTTMTVHQTEVCIVVSLC